jgi:aromatase
MTMPVARVHRMVSETTTPAPAAILYGLLTDTARWPLYFPHYVHVERLGFDGTHERLHSWIIAEDRVHSWVSSRELDAERRRVIFHQDLTDAPLTSVHGVLTVHPLGDHHSRMVLERSFTLTEAAPADVAWAQRVARAGGDVQLDRLAWLAQRWLRLDDLMLTCEDTVRLEGSPDAALDFLYRTGDWATEPRPRRNVHLVEKVPGVQVMSVDNPTAPGSTRHTESVRICFPGAGRLVHKDTVTSALMFAHTGEWSVEPDATGLSLTARHHVLLKEDAIAGVLGEHASLAEAGHHVRQQLSRQALTVLHQATAHAAGGTGTR